MMRFFVTAERGFTLIEVLAALIVLALTLGGIMNASVFYGRNAVYLQNKTVASWIANNQLSEVQLERSWVPIGRSNGRLEMAQQEWFWEREVKKTPDDRLRRVILRVRLENDEEDAWLANLSAFFAEPQRSTLPATPNQGQIAPPGYQGS